MLKVLVGKGLVVLVVGILDVVDSVDVGLLKVELVEVVGDDNLLKLVLGVEVVVVLKVLVGRGEVVLKVAKSAPLISLVSASERMRYSPQEAP